MAELPDLDKLQITPVSTQAKSNQNPFAENMKINPQISSDDQRNKTRTRCRFRRASESALELRVASDPSADQAECTKRTPPSNGLRQPLKKCASTARRKLILREPVLRALQTCLQHTPNPNPTKPTQGYDSSSQNDCSLPSKGMSNFRDLIEECRNLLNEDVDFNVSSRNSKNFTTMQTPLIPNGSKIRNSSIKPHKKLLMSERTRTDDVSGSCSKESNFDGTQHSLNQPPLYLQRSGLPTTSSPEHVTNNARSSTCSQQAGCTASAAPDDVTIDELASYFDTFVHIPKKMSSMAEMMYT